MLDFLCVKTLGTIFAKSQYLKGKVIDKNYFDTTWKRNKRSLESVL